MKCLTRKGNDYPPVIVLREPWPRSLLESGLGWGAGPAREQCV